MREGIQDLTALLLGTGSPTWLYTVMSLMLLGLFAWLAYMVWSRVIAPILRSIVERTPTDWDDAILNMRVLRSVGQLLPALIVDYYLPSMFMDGSERFYDWLSKLTDVYIVWAIWFLLQRVMKSVYVKLVEGGHISEHSSKGLLQMCIIVLSCGAVIISASICMGRSPVAILTALGASTAVLMLVFKDTIMGLVAGVQLSANKMLKKGDWIIVDKAGANGEVEDVSLTTVKVRNWDESITTIPPYVLISESFHNYDNMRVGGGRRVMRSIYLDVNSVRFLNDTEIAALVKDGFVTADEVAQSHDRVNLRLFRHYLERMLRSNPNVREDMRMMVRQLQPTPTGLPLELFFFVRQTEWTSFEAVQSDIFDSVYAVVNRFALRLYQMPAGTDIPRVL